MGDIKTVMVCQKHMFWSNDGNWIWKIVLGGEGVSFFFHVIVLRFSCIFVVICAIAKYVETSVATINCYRPPEKTV